MLSRLTETWSSAEDAPVGIPENYPVSITAGFTVQNQSSYPPIWQRD
jgi:hypothetical protein